MLLKETKANLSLLFRFISQTYFPICVDKCWSDFITIFRCSATLNTKYELSFLEAVLKTLCTRNPFVQLGERMRPEPEQELLSPGSANRFHRLREEHKLWMSFQELDLAAWRLGLLLSVGLGWCCSPAWGGHGAGDTWLGVGGSPAQPRAHLCPGVLALFSQVFTSSSLLAHLSSPPVSCREKFEIRN